MHNTTELVLNNRMRKVVIKHISETTNNKYQIVSTTCAPYIEAQYIPQTQTLIITKEYPLPVLTCDKDISVKFGFQTVNNWGLDLQFMSHLNVYEIDEFCYYYDKLDHNDVYKKLVGFTLQEHKEIKTSKLFTELSNSSWRYIYIKLLIQIYEFYNRYELEDTNFKTISQYTTELCMGEQNQNKLRNQYFVTVMMYAELNIHEPCSLLDSYLESNIDTKLTDFFLINGRKLNCSVTNMEIFDRIINEISN